MMVFQRIRGYAPLRRNNQPVRKLPQTGDFELNTAYDPASLSQPELPLNQEFRFVNDLPSGPKVPSSPLNTNWNPLFLRKWVLLAFAIFFAAVIVALQILYSFSLRNDGIATTDGGKHYLWTYGPTALFVLVTVLWRQVDYAAKSIQPWAEMAKGPQPASNSLLLDYVTPLQIVAFWRSLRHGHFNVSSTIVVFVLIKVMTVASTGIFSLRSIADSDISTVMALNNTFDASLYDHGSSVDARPASTVWGHRAYNNSLPFGTTDQYAVQSFAPQGEWRNGSLGYNATVDVFSAMIQCETGILTYNTSRDPASNAPISMYYNTSVTLPDCEISNAYLDAPDWFYSTNDTTHRFGYRARFQNATCRNLPEDDPTRYRYLIAAAYSEGKGQNNNTMLNSSNIVCIPNYSIQSAAVSLDTNGGVRSVVPSNVLRQIEGISGNDIGLGVYQSLQQTGSLVTNDPDLVLDNFFALMQEDTTNFENSSLLDTQYLNTTASRIFTKIAAQVASRYLLLPTETGPQPTVLGSISKNVNRLLVQPIPVRVMQGASAAMLVLSLLMIFTTPRGVVPRSIDSIVAIAAILARSKQLEEELRHTGYMSIDELRTILAPYSFWTHIEHVGGVRSFSIQLSSRSESSLRTNSISRNSNYHNIKWIQPFVLRRVAILGTILISIAAIIALEVLLSRSQANNGLATVGDNAATRYSWLYVPMIVFLLLGTLFNIMDFEIEFTESYHALAKGFCDARSSMLWYPLKHVSLHATWNGLKHSRFALTAASASAVFAPFLTIVVAGLFFTRSTLTTTPIDLNVLLWFNASGEGTTEAFVIPSLIIQGNMSYPDATYDELAFPVFDKVQTANGTGSISVDSPAVRAGVVCTPIPESRILNATISGSHLQTNISMPDGCGNSGMIDQPMNWLTNSPTVPVNETGYFGSTLTLGFEDNCPTIALYYGHVTDNHLDNFQAVTCSQFVEQVQTNLTLTYPDFAILSPPDVYPNSSVRFSNWYVSFPELLEVNITGTNDTFDTTFNAVVYGRDGVPQSELLDVDRLIEGYTHLYRQYVAQEMNFWFRAGTFSLPDNETEAVREPLKATLSESNDFRLIQSPLSTHLLVGFLVALLICAVVIFITVDMRHVLPKPVGSIASVASLLAGSRLVSEDSGLIPKGSEFWSDDQWEKTGILQGEMFKMGYWNGAQEPVESVRKIRMPRFGRSSSNEEDDMTIRASFRIDAKPRIVS